VHAFINDGAAAGASLPHVHAQLLVLERAAHTEQLTAHTLNFDTCAICALATQHPQLLVEQAHHHALWAHPAPRMGGGLVIAPLDHSSPLGEHIAELAHLLMRAIAVCGPQDLNCWLVADEQTGAHWYLEVQPRTAQLAGVELALSLNVIAAEPAHTAAVARERLGHVTSSAPR
jgi:UDPglucose--hexose-1-phosphate uridylyltransferase